MTSGAQGGRLGKGWLRFRSQGLLQVFAIMGFLYLVIFNYVPMFGLQIAFRDYKPTMGLAGFFTAPVTSDGGFYHFLTFFNHPDFGIIMRNTLSLSLLKLLFAFPLPIVFALALNEMRGTKIKRIVQTVSYLPHFISWLSSTGGVHAEHRQRRRQRGAVAAIKDRISDAGIPLGHGRGHRRLEEARLVVHHLPGGDDRH